MQIDFQQKFCNHILNVNTFQDTDTKLDPQKGNLFLGGVNCLKNQILTKNNIKSVLTIMGDLMIQKGRVIQKIKEAGIKTHQKFQIDDDQSEDIRQFFEDSYIFISQNIKTGNVLVHCQVGASRSASIVIAFMMKHFKMKFSDSYARVKKKRKEVNPNVGFIKALQEYQNQLKQQSLLPSQVKKKQDKIQIKSKKRKNYSHIISIFGNNQKQKGNIFLGGVWSFQENINQDSIFAVLSVLTKDKMDAYNIFEKIQILMVQDHKWLDKEDVQDEDILTHFQEAYDFITKCLNKTNILIHCQAGISRSASFVIAFIMKYNKMPLKNAISFVKAKRVVVSPNEGFQNQLLAFQKQLMMQGKL